MENNYLATDDTTNYMGINTANRIFPGWGRTWNVGLTYRFQVLVFYCKKPPEMGVFLF